jgi:hypothetical protein
MVYDVKYAIVTKALVNGKEEVLGVEHKSKTFNGAADLNVQVFLAKEEKVKKEFITVESVSKS